MKLLISIVVLIACAGLAAQTADIDASEKVNRLEGEGWSSKGYCQTLLHPPTNLLAATNFGRIHLSWDEPELTSHHTHSESLQDSISADNHKGSGLPVNLRNRVLLGYNVYRDGEQINTLIVEETCYCDIDVVIGVTYTYYVTAVYEQGESEPSDVVEVMIEFQYPPPVNLTAEVIDYNKVHLEWDPPGTISGDIEQLIYENKGIYTGTWETRNEAYLIRAVVLYPDGRIAELAPTVQPGIPNPVSPGERMPVAVSGEDNRPAGRSGREHTGYRVYLDGEPIGETAPNVTTYTDTEVEFEFFVTYVYYVTALYGDIESEPSNEVEIQLVNIGESTADPLVSALRGNYPNPFNPETRISFSLARAGMVRIEIYNIRGQLVKILLDDYYNTGNYDIVWDGRDDSGKPVTSGVYFYRMTAPDFEEVNKMLLLK